jgi:hypothetical protein
VALKHLVPSSCGEFLDVGPVIVSLTGEKDESQCVA